LGGGTTVSSYFNENGHLTADAFTALKNGSLNDGELIVAAEHIGICPACATTLSTSFDDNELAQAPSGFAQQVQSRADEKYRSSIQLVFYSLRVTAAVCAALVIVFSGSLRSIANAQDLSAVVKAPSFGFIDSINSSLRDFSQKVVRLEDFNYAKEKK
jgi:hypothetical protein